jgi:hypothetical protein
VESDYALDEPEPSRSSFPAAPVAITAAGVAILGTGIAFGLMAKASEQDYADAPIGSRERIDAALEKLDEAETQATIANVGIGLGAAVIALGVTLWVVALSDDGRDGEQSAWLAPRLAPREVGVTVGGRL